MEHGVTSSQPIVYLAGPAVFHPAVKALFKHMVEVCAEHGLTAIIPFGGDGSQDALLASLSPTERATAIRAGNIERIASCDVVLACISPFRGPGADPGTAWEMGYGEALGKNVVAWCEDSQDYMARVPHDCDDDGRIFCRQHGMLVENFNLPDNLMLTAGPHGVQCGFEAALTFVAALLAPKP